MPGQRSDGAVDWYGLMDPTWTGTAQPGIMEKLSRIQNTDPTYVPRKGGKNGKLNALFPWLHP